MFYNKIEIVSFLKFYKRFYTVTFDLYCYVRKFYVIYVILCYFMLFILLCSKIYIFNSVNVKDDIGSRFIVS